MRASRNNFYRQLSVSQDKQQWGLYLTCAGKAETDPGDAYPSGATHPDSYRFKWTLGRTLPDFHLLWIAKGKGEFQLEQKQLLPLPSGSVLLLPPQTWHRYRPSFGSSWTEYWVGFNGDFARELVRSRAIDSQPSVITNIPAACLEAPFEKLIGRLTPGSECVERLLAANVFHLLALALGAGKIRSTEIIAHAGAAAGDQLVYDAMAIIRSAGRESITVEQLVEEMLVARRTLERAFRKQLGHGIHEEILHYRLERTRRLLSNRSMSIDEIAIESGFGNVRSLRRAFAAAMGMSPQAYRNLISSDPKAA